MKVKSSQNRETNNSHLLEVSSDESNFSEIHYLDILEEKKASADQRKNIFR